ncbi:MAG: 4a-hydroxytetrahydrobiopterin dehydratase [Gemmatimonadaceae bacterium]
MPAAASVGQPSGMTSDQVEQRLTGLSGWTRDGEAIQKQFVFDAFASAVAFVVRVGFDAEAADHHPDVLISNYKKVTLTFTTHSAGGLTDKDFAGADAAERVFAGTGNRA